MGAPRGEPGRRGAARNASGSAASALLARFLVLSARAAPVLLFVRPSVVLVVLVALVALVGEGRAATDEEPAGARRGPLRLLRVTPEGSDVPTERQIVFQFDRPVVPLGRMARRSDEVPIRITPDPGCAWRWIDPSALACELGDDNPLSPATRYRIRVGPGFESVDGARLEAGSRHEFVTRRPTIRYRWFQTWTAPGMPVLRVSFDQAVTEESVARHLFFRLPSGRRVPASIELDAERHNTFYVRPQRELPADSRVSLQIEPGIRSEAGPEPSVASGPVVVFATFAPPRFLGVECHDIEGDPVVLLPATSSDRRCDPTSAVRLVFSAPVRADVLAEHLRVTPDLAGGREDFDPWASVHSRSRLSRPPRGDARYAVPLPRGLKAFASYALSADAADVRDEFGRPLDRDLDFTFLTDHRPPRLHLGHPTSVLESGVETHLPVVVTNLDAVQTSFDRLTAAGVDSKTQTLSVEDVADVAFRKPLPVRDWLEDTSGAVLGQMSSVPRLSGQPDWFFSQVTPFHVNVKLGHYNTLVWVTDMATGEPVRDAAVRVYAHDFESLAEPDPILATAQTDRDGLARLPGGDVLDPDGERVRRYWKRRSEEHLFVRVDKGADLAIVPLARDFQVPARGPNQAWIDRDERRRQGHLRAWGATAQGVYRTGDTVRFKFWVRTEGNERLVPAPREGYALEVLDPTDKTVHRLEAIELDRFGSYAGEFTVPENGAVGWYRFALEATFAERFLTPMRVLVADFRPAPFRVRTELAGDRFGPGDTVTAESRARLHAGGPYRDADSRVVARLRAAPLREVDPLAKGFHFDTGKPGVVELVHRSEALLDAAGDRRTEFTLPESEIQYGSLEVESSVRDDRGKYVAGSSRARFVGRDRYVGILQEDWLLEAGEPAELRAVVVDERGRLVSGTSIEFLVERRVTSAARVKEAGNAYVKRYTHRWETVATCREIAAAEPVRCAFTPDAGGRYRLSASVVDTRGRASRSQLHRWAMGRGQLLWEEPPGHHLEIAPEKEELRVGDTARYLVRNPFPGARALVTVERYGVIRSWTEVFEGSTEIVEFEVEPDFLPGFYVSVVVTSPRVEAPGPEQLEEGAVDLGKPAFRMGYARTLVRDPYKELAIAVEPERERYEPGDRVRVDIRARTHELLGWRADAELAVAVLDEAVLDLIAGGRRAYDPYRGFYGLGGLDLRNYDLLTRLVGIQRFEQKGASPGGGGDGGGDGELRSRFEFVSYWNPSLRLDWRGRARVEFEVPDNLTSWRVLVFGATTGDRMGLGDASFRVNQPTEIRPALPNRVLEGDRFTARFTVMNRTEQSRALDVTIRAEGEALAEPVSERTRLEAAPYRREAVALPVGAERPGEIAFDVRAGDDLHRDGLRVAVPVETSASFEVAASYGSTEGARASQRIRFPEGIRADAGRLAVSASPTVLGGLDGAFRYMSRYPYRCWEQQLSRGVMAAHYQELAPWLPDSVAWPGSEGLPAEMLAEAANFQAPNGGMAFYVPRDDYASPYLSAYTALAFQWLRARGYEVPAAVESPLHGYLQKLLRKDVFPDFYSKGMASSVRAVALAALAPSGAVGASDLERHRPHAGEMDLFGKAWLLRAAAGIEGSEELQAELRDAILAHGIQTGGQLVYGETLDDGHARILHTGLRSQCSILGAFAALSPELAAPLGDAAPKLVRSVTATRGRRDHWENTQENVFCTNALVDYARAYESEEPDFSVRVSLGDEELGSARFSERRAAARDFARPIRPGDPGRDVDLAIERSGVGRLYYAARLFFAPEKRPVERANAGIDVRREYSVERDGRWLKLDSPYRIRSGELVRVDLYVSLPTARNFVVVDDPVPGALEPVNRDLATASTVDADQARDTLPPDAYYFAYDDWRSFAWTRWSFYHRELRHEAARFYSDYLPAGRYHLSYVAQAIAAGSFGVLPLRAEQMYEPDVYGRGLPARLEVEDSGD